jgi:hypothetical protein
MNPSADREKQLRRLEAKLASVAAKNMSNAKWLALFAALREAGIAIVRWKFIQHAHIFVHPIPGETELVANGFGDVLPAPYATFRELEWLEVPAVHSELFARLRASHKAFPWQESAEGLRVVAYEW